jgi:hypothetical protein
LGQLSRDLLAQVTDTTTFTDEARRAEVDAWLYETCTQCLQHMVDIVVQFYPVVQPLLARILDLLSNFIRCAAGGRMMSSFAGRVTSCERQNGLVGWFPANLLRQLQRVPQVCEQCDGMVCCCCRRPHQSLAAVGVAALVRLVTSAGGAMSEEVRSVATALPAKCSCDEGPYFNAFE